MRESRRWLGCHGGPERSTKSEVEASATRWHYGRNSSAYVTFQQTHMRSTILVRSTIHTRAVLLSIDQHKDMHQHLHNKHFLQRVAHCAEHEFHKTNKNYLVPNYRSDKLSMECTPCKRVQSGRASGPLFALSSCPGSYFVRVF